MFKLKIMSYISILIFCGFTLFAGRLSYAQPSEVKSITSMEQSRMQLSATAARKIPSNLRLLFNAPPEFLLLHGQSMNLSQIETAEPMVDVLVKIIGDGKVLETVGAQPGSQIGDICTARIPIHRLGELASLSSVVSIQPSMKLKLSLDASTSENKAKVVQQGNYSSTPPAYSGFTGKGVLVVTIDTGIDWRHEDFINDHDGKSRVCCIWDQTLVPTAGENHPTGFSYGVEYTSTDINNEIDGSPANFVRTKDTEGHGSHVAGIIAGDGSASGRGVPAYTYVGMAPEAQLLVIKSGLYTSQIIDAVNYAMRKADDLGLPVVINLSLGNQFTAHDGTSLLDQAMDYACNTEKVIIVAAAGNEGTDAIHGQYIHAEGTVTSGTSDTTEFIIPSYTPNSGGGNDLMLFNFWYQGNDKLTVKIVTPNGYNVTAVSNSNNDNSFYYNRDGAIYIDNSSSGVDPVNGDRMCFIQIWDYQSSAPPRTGTWKIIVTGETVLESGHYDNWLPISQVGNKSVYFSASSGSNREIIASPGSAENVITVAAHSTKTSWINYTGSTQTLSGSLLNNLAYFSSVGPTRDDPGYITGLQKPEICASGFGTISVLSADATYWNTTIYRNRDGKHFLQSGTSMAAPHVTGAIALMLDKNYTLTAAQAKRLLTNTAHSDAYTGSVPNSSWGYGKLDIDAAIQQVNEQQRGLSIFPAEQISDGLPGSMVSYIATIRNLGKASDSYDLNISGNRWPTTIWNAMGTNQISNTGNIAAGTEMNIIIKVQVPENTTPSQRDAAIVTAASNGYQDQVQVITFTPAVLPWSDKFPTTTLNTTKWTFNGGPAAINSDAYNEPSAYYSLNLNGDEAGGDEVQSQSINLSGKNSVVLSYYYQRTGGGDSPEESDDLWVDYFDANNRWTNLRHYSGSGSDMNSFSMEQILLPDAAYHHRFKIRFYCVGTSGFYSDDWFIDEVSINEVIPTITVSYPDLPNIKWNIGQGYNITWTTLGNVGANVRIELYKGPFLNRTIETSTANDGSYFWSIPSDQIAGSDFKIKITSATDATINDFSNNTFTINPKAFILVSTPNGGEVWNVGTNQNITWTSSGTSGNVKIEYSTNNGSIWSTIINSTLDDGVHTWNIPNTPSTNCLVKISDTDGDPFDLSNNIFTIRTEQIILTTPNGDEVWKAGTRHDITWTSTGISGEIRIEYSTNNGTSWKMITPNTANDGLEAWIIPDEFSSQCLVRVADASDGTPSDVSNKVFSIIPLNLSGAWALSYDGVDDVALILDNPLLSGGSKKSLTIEAWVKLPQISGTRPLVEKFLDGNSKDWGLYVDEGRLGVSIESGGDNWNYFAGAVSAGVWTHVAFAFDNTADMVRLFINGTEAGTGASQTKDLPDTQADILLGSRSYSNLHTVGLIDEVRIWNLPRNSTELKNNMNRTLAGNESGLIGYWRFDEGIGQISTDLSGNGNTVRLGTTNGVEASDPAWVVSDVPLFDITPLMLTSPNGGESWAAGTEQNITWTSTGAVPNVKLEYSTNNGTGWTTIAANSPNDGSEVWTIPNESSTQCLVRVSDAVDGNPVDQSDLLFSIIAVPTLTLTAPNGGESWMVGTAQNITWTSTGTVAEVKLEYSTNNGTSWTTIITSTVNDGNYSWNIPNVMSSQCLVRVSDAVDGNPVDISDSVFSITIIPTLTLTAPNGGESWMVGTVQNITWTSTGAVPKVKLEYSTNNGSGWKPIAASTTNDGSETWTIPNEPSIHCVVRVSDVVDGNPVDQSDSLFSITVVPTLTLTAPNGGESWTVGTVQNITWTSTGAVPKVKLEYSTTNGSGWKPLAASTPNDGSETWTIPNESSIHCLVRVSDAVDGNPVDQSDSLFSITAVPTLVLTAPNGGESWMVGTTQNITWTSTGAVPKVKLEYSTNNGTAWTMIIANTPNDGNEVWTIPNEPSTQCLVRVSDTVDGNPVDQSNSLFSITTVPTLTLTAPNGGESWMVGTAQNITWTSTGAVPKVKLEYSTNNGTAWTIIIANTPNDGNEVWTIPNEPSTQCLVRVSDVVDGNPVDQSNALFSITVVPTLTLTAPNGGESWMIGTAQTITWTSTGAVPKVKLEYSTNNGTAWTMIAASTPNDGSEVWTIPNKPSTQCLVRVSDAVDGDPVDISDSLFSITAVPTLTLTAPNGGESWMISTAQTITWTSTGTVAEVKLEYSTNNGTYWTTIITSTVNDGNYSWNIPNVMSSQCLVRVSEAADGNPIDQSDSLFSITVVPTLTLTAPNGGESWMVGTTQNITWTSTGVVANVKLEYSTNNGTAWTMIAASTPNDGSEVWTIPNEPSTQCLVRVSDVVDGNPVDQSDALFSITVVPTLTLTAPNGGESWMVGTAQTITWTSTGAVPKVKLEYSTNNGTAWTMIITNTPNDGSEVWTIPNEPSTQCLVRISDAADGNPVDLSDAVFSITAVPTLTLTTPNGGESWRIGTRQTITWSSTGSVADVKLEYSTNNGAAWKMIAASTPNDGSEFWTIPNEPSMQCLVRVSDVIDGNPADQSNALFSITVVPTLTLTAPNGGEIWTVGTIQNITWKSTGAVPKVKLEYSINKGTAWTMIAASTPNDGSEVWTIPNEPKNYCLVRVSDAGDSTVSDISDVAFFIGDLTLIEDSSIEVILSYALLQNYPNPFNSTTKINFTLMEPAYVRLEVYDVMGGLTKVLLNGKYEEGSHQISWDGTNLDGNKVTSGVYFCSFLANKYKEIRKMVLMQ